MSILILLDPSTVFDKIEHTTSPWIPQHYTLKIVLVPSFLAIHVSFADSLSPQTYNGLKYLRTQVFYCFSFLFTFTLLVTASSFTILNTICSLTTPKCSFPAMTSPQNSRLNRLNCLLNISTWMTNKHLNVKCRDWTHNLPPQICSSQYSTSQLMTFSPF